MTLSKGAESAESDVTALVSSSPTSQDGESNESGSKALDSGDEDTSHGYYSKKRFSRRKRSVCSKLIVNFFRSNFTNPSRSL